MQWLMKFRVLWDIHKSCHGFHPALQHLRCQSLSGAGAPRWNDYDTPEEFNFASDILDYWTQMEKIIDDKGNILPPNTEGNIGIRIKPTRPIGVFMHYEVEIALNEACVNDAEVKPEEPHEQENVQLNIRKEQVTSFTPIDCLNQRTENHYFLFNF
eukprot:bmy_06295T0